MSEKRGVSKKIKTNIINMNSCLLDLDRGIGKIWDELNWLMGRNPIEVKLGPPLWNGVHALKFYKKAIGNLKNDTIDYNYATKVVEKLAIQYEIVVNKDNK